MTFIQQVIEIRDDVIDPQHIVFGEHDTGVHDHEVVPILVNDHILPNFPQASQGNDAKFLVAHCFLFTSEIAWLRVPAPSGDFVSISIFQ